MTESHRSPPTLGPILADRVAVVTGAGAGIGFACARVLGAAAASIAVWDIDEAAANSAAEQLRRLASGREAFIADVSQASAVESTIAEIIGEYGAIDMCWSTTPARMMARALKKAAKPTGIGLSTPT